MGIQKHAIKKHRPLRCLVRALCLFGVFHLKLFELDIMGVDNGLPGSQRLQDARHVDDHPGRQPEPERDKSRPLHKVNGMLFELDQPERKENRQDNAADAGENRRFQVGKVLQVDGEHGRDDKGDDRKDSLKNLHQGSRQI